MSGVEATTMDNENILWRRGAILRPIRLPRIGERAHILGDRFEVQVSRSPDRKTPVPALEIAPVVMSDSKCRGVVGEIVLGHDRIRARAPEADPLAAKAGTPITPLKRRRDLIMREAERLARVQIERRSERGR